MNRLLPFWLAFGLLASNGCLSTHVVKNKAQAHREYDPDGVHSRQVPGKPAYYALLPLTAAADVTTYPFQLVFLSGASPREATLYVRGWPVPLPLP